MQERTRNGVSGVNGATHERAGTKKEMLASGKTPCDGSFAGCSSVLQHENTGILLIRFGALRVFILGGGR